MPSVPSAPRTIGRSCPRSRLALGAPAEIDGAFNVASGTPRSVGELAAELARAVGGDPPEITSEYRLGDVRHVFASTVKARDDLGFAASADFSDTVAEFATAPLRDPPDGGWSLD